jgi:zinc protease
MTPSTVSFWRVLCLLAALPLALSQPAQSAAAGAAAPKVDYESYRLPNGLTVILSEDKRLPLVSVNLWYHVGPANEKPGRTGFAHLFEHMMFQGSKNVPEDQHFAILEGAGATQINGTTDLDRTNYFETLPSNQLELALWIESDRMGSLLEKLDQTKLSNQQDVVRNERRQSTENQPYGLVEEALFHTLYPKGHPYYGSVIGSHADIEAVRLGDVREFFREFYTPNNASLAIVGDFDKKSIKALVAKYFGGLPSGPAVEPVKVLTPPITSERRVVVTDKVELPRIYMAWFTPALYQPGDADADLLASILGGGKSSRLYRKLVYDLQIAQNVSVSQNSLQLGSVFQIEATARPGVTPEQLEQAIDAELALIREQGPSNAELQRARNGILTSILRSLETTMGVANRLSGYEHYLRSPGFLQQDIARYQQADVASIRGLAQQALRREARVVLYGVPGEKHIEDVPRVLDHAAEPAPVTTPPDWRAQRPAPGKASQFALPAPRQFKLPNGLTVLLLEQHRLPVISASLVLLAGSDRNPADKPGLAAFTADLLDEGTATRSSTQLADDVAMLGASLASGSNMDYSSVSLYSLTSTADAAMGLLGDVALHPAFAAAELDRVRSSRLTQLMQQRENPTALAQRVFNQALYGTHPYGYTEVGTLPSLQGLSREDVISFWQAGYQPGNAALVVAGDITEAQLRALVEKHLGDWQGAVAAKTSLSVQQLESKKILLVDKPGAPQTALRVGQVAVARSSPDYVPLEVMNNTLGGLFSSRINLNLREKNGYTYGAGSAFGFRRGPGPFVVSTSVRTDVTAPAVREIYNELQTMRTQPVSSAELMLSKDSLVRSLPGLFETLSSTVGSSAQLFVHGLPLDYYRRMPTAISAVTAADVLRVARAHLQPDAMVVVAVGDKAKIEQPLRQLELGPVEIRLAP